MIVIALPQLIARVGVGVVTLLVVIAAAAVQYVAIAIWLVS